LTKDKTKTATDYAEEVIAHWRKENKDNYKNVFSASNITGSAMICKENVCKIETVFFERKHIPIITDRKFSDNFA
jgi:hypothetical protein